MEDDFQMEGDGDDGEKDSDDGDESDESDVEEDEVGGEAGKDAAQENGKRRVTFDIVVEVGSHFLPRA